MKITATIKDQKDLRIRTTSYQSRRIGDLTDVDTSSLEDGSVLVYNIATEKWESTITLEKQIINGGNF